MYTKSHTLFSIFLYSHVYLLLTFQRSWVRSSILGLVTHVSFSFSAKQNSPHRYVMSHVVFLRSEILLRRKSVTVLWVSAHIAQSVEHLARIRKVLCSIPSRVDHFSLKFTFGSQHNMHIQLVFRGSWVQSLFSCKFFFTCYTNRCLLYRIETRYCYGALVFL